MLSRVNDEVTGGEIKREQKANLREYLRGGLGTEWNMAVDSTTQNDTLSKCPARGIPAWLPFPGGSPATEWNRQSDAPVGFVERKATVESNTGVDKYLDLPPEERIQKMAERQGEHWAQRIEQFRTRNPQTPKGGIVLLGDSITEAFLVERWFDGLPVVNQGIGGDRIDGVGARLHLSVTDLEPRQLFLLVGINDIVWTSLSIRELSAEYKRLLDEIRATNPACELVVQSVLPTRGDFAKFNPAVRNLNERVQKTAAAHNLQYLNLHPDFVDEAGELRSWFTYDGVHLTEEAYEQWAAILRPLMKLD
jgi:lysophospholipase L1-like esterase